MNNSVRSQGKISIKNDVVMVRVNNYLIRISNLKFFPGLYHDQDVEGIVYRYDEINGERSFNKNGKNIRFKIITAN